MITRPRPVFKLKSDLKQVFSFITQLRIISSRGGAMPESESVPQASPCASYSKLKLVGGFLTAARSQSKTQTGKDSKLNIKTV